jgi:hypothetical protein
LLNAEYGEALEKIFFRLAKVLRRKGRKLRKLSQQELQEQSRVLNKKVLDLPHHLAPVGDSEPKQVATLRSA